MTGRDFADLAASFFVKALVPIHRDIVFFIKTSLPVLCYLVDNRVVPNYRELEGAYRFPN